MQMLTNARHERFAQSLAKGMSADAAHTAAGYKPHRQNAARMSTYDDIRARVAELQGSTAKQITDIRDLARQYTAEATELQVAIMRDEKAPASVRLAASMALHDRGHGKATQYLEADISVYDSLGLAEQQALLAMLDALAEGPVIEVELDPLALPKATRGATH